MADEVTMTPVAGAEPPKADPMAKIAPKPALKLPPKPGATISALRPGLKLPTQNAMRPGLKLPPKPVIRKPGSTVATMPLPRPVPHPVAPAAPAAAAPAAAPAAEAAKPIEQLKAVTQKLKGITQEIPQQAILRKTGIIADEAMSEAQKEAAKHKTARISLSDAMGVAPVKEEAAPMKTIRIKRPVNLPTPTGSNPKPVTTAAPSAAPSAASAAASPAPSVTQRKTLKITRPVGAVRPSGKFAAPPKPASAPSAPTDDVADIPDLPQMPVPQPAAAPESGFVVTLSLLVQLAACAAIGALAWFLYQNTVTNYF